MSNQVFKQKDEQRKWVGSSVKILPYTGPDRIWKDTVDKLAGGIYEVQEVCLSANGHIVFLALKGLPGLAFDAYKDVQEVN